MDTASLLNGVAGGVLIGASAVFLMGMMGRIAGISGIVSGLLYDRARSERIWKGAFVVGLVLAPLMLTLVVPEWGNRAGMAAGAIGEPLAGLPVMIVAGLLVGLGTGLGAGCTSGHGVCGMARLSTRSITATLVFLACGMATVFVVRHLLGGGA
ncbi:MAG: YeeE/YedE family protein [Pseudomonadota bacterium]